MPWIKRNLYFVIAVALGLAVTGYCGFLLYSILKKNADISDQYATSRKNLDDLQNKKPFPDQETIQAAEEDEERVQSFLADFQNPFSGFPPPTRMDDRQFKDFLQKTVSQFGLEATNAGVGLLPYYAFSFSQQLDRLNYPAECIEPWLQELEEIKAILNVLYDAKINFLEKIRRPAVSPDESGDDIIQFNSISNQWGVVTPYRIEFRAFSAELANVLSAIATSSNCFIVKTLFVTPSKVLPQMIESQPLPGPVAQPQYTIPQYLQESSQGAPFRRGGARRAGGESPERERRQLQMRQAPIITAPSTPTGPVTILRENPLFVTLYIDVVKLKSTVVKPKSSALKPKTSQTSNAGGKSGARSRRRERR